MNREPHPFVMLRCPFQIEQDADLLDKAMVVKVDIICITFYIHHCFNIMVQVKIYCKLTFNYYGTYLKRKSSSQDIQQKKIKFSLLEESDYEIIG